VVLYAALTLALLIAVVPFLWVIVGSFKSNAEIFQSPFALPRTWRYDNFVRAWVEGHFGTYFFNSLGIAIPTTLLILACGSLAGFAFARLKFWGSTILFYVFLSSLAISTNSIMIPLFHMIYNAGLVDSYWGVVFPTVASHMPMASFLMRAFFRSLPNELEDAARIDGCNNFGVYWYIMLPLSRGAMLGTGDLRVHGLLERVPGAAAGAPRPGDAHDPARPDRVPGPVPERVLDPVRRGGDLVHPDAAGVLRAPAPLREGHHDRLGEG
jgi:ABC-type glycerol-3-phosphate transport system permease component